MRKHSWSLAAAAPAVLGVLALAGPASPAPAEQEGERQGCEVVASGSLPDKRSFRLEARLEDEALQGKLEFLDRPERLDLDSTAVTDLVVDGEIASLQGVARTGKKDASVLFSATLDATARTFSLQLSNGYSATGVVGGKSPIVLTGSCPAPDGTTPAVDAIDDVASERAQFAPEEVTDESGVEIVRTQLELELAPDATVAQMNELLARLGAEVVSSLDGVGLLTVRIPDPGSLAALRDLVTGLAGAPGLARADLATVPVPTELPEIVGVGDVSPVRPQLASRAAAAWNVRGALDDATPPTLVLGDYFGAGPPGPETAVQETAADFATGNPHPHGYSVLGLAAATFEPGAVAALAADQVTGMWAGPDIPLRVVDLRFSIAGSTAQDRLLQTVRGLSGNVVVNTSFADGCAPTGCTVEQIEADARQWIRRVRDSGLENRFLHVSAAGNIYPTLPTDTLAALGAAFNASALTPPAGLTALTNTIVVENTTASDPASGPVVPLCLTATSKRGGHISAVGNDIKSFGAPGVFRDLPEGGTSNAAPQVAGAAATVWALAPSLTPAQLVGLLRATARPVTTTSGDPRCGSTPAAPALDFYAAVLAADRAVAQPARSEILDADGDGDFDAQDLQAFRDAFIAAAGAVDYGRFDLNGDGRTGGGRDRYDLDMSSPPAWTFSQRREILGLEVGHDETSVRDLDVLCHEAHGPLFTAGDTAARDLFAEQFCLPPVEIETDPAFPGALLPGQVATLRIRAERSDLTDPIVSHQSGVHLDFTSLSGTLGAASGTTGLDGAFSTTASLPASGDFAVTVIARAGPGGPELDRITVRASRGESGSGVRVLFRIAQAAAHNLESGEDDNKNFAEEPPLAFGAVSHSAAVSGAFATHFSSLLGTSSSLDASGNMNFAASQDHARSSSTFSVGFVVEDGPLRYVLEATTTHSGNPNCSTDVILMDGQTGVLIVSSGTAPANVSRSGTLSPGTYQLVVGGGCLISGSGGAIFDFFLGP